MATTLHHLLPYERGHMIELCLWEKPLTWEEFWQDMCCLDHIQLAHNILYYFQAFEKLMAAKRWLDGHSSYHVWRKQEEEQRWSDLKDYCHHPTCNMTLIPCFFWSPYGDDTLFTLCMKDWARRLPRTNEWNHEIQNIFCLHEDYIIAAQD